MNKRKLIPQLVFNSMIVLLTIIGLIIGCTMDGFNASILKYFTTESNILIAIASLIYVIHLILIFKNKANHIPKGFRIFKFIATVSVVLTFLTVVLLLAPTSKDATFLFSNSQAIFHVVTPLLSLTTWLLFEHNKDFKLPESCYGLITVLIYGIFYLINCLTHIQAGKVKPEYDWYGFTGFGINLIPVVMIVMFGLTYLICWLLWLGNKKINIKYELMSNWQYKRFWAIFVNGLIGLLFLITLLVRFVHDQADYTNLKYFTTQSNIIMGIMAFVYMGFQIKQFNDKQINKTASLLKLFATVYVAITFAVTVCLLTPGAAIAKLPNWPVSRLYLNANIMFHVFIPLLSVANWICLEHTTKIKFNNIWYSLMYVGAYGIFYLAMAYSHIKLDGTIPMEYDWYKFCAFGPLMTILFFNVIIGATFSFSLLFWNTNKRINLYK